MALKKANFRIKAPNRGVNLQDLDISIDDTEASDILNMELKAYGVRKRPGYIKAGTNAVGTKVQGGGRYYKNSGNRENLRICNRKLQKYDAGTDTWGDVSVATGAGFTVEALTDIIQANNYAWLQNGTDALQYYDQTSLKKMPSGQIGNGIYEHKGRLWTWAGSRLYFSQVESNNLGTLTVSGASNATPIVITTSAAHGLTTGNQVSISGVGGNTAANGDWVVTVLTSTTFSLDGSVSNGAYTTGGTVTKLGRMGNFSTISGSAASAGYVDVRKDDGEEITVCRDLGNRFVVWKEGSIWEIVLNLAPSSDTDILSELRNVTLSVGCVARNSVQMVQDDYLFMGAGGVYRLGLLPQFLDSLRTTEISFPVRPEIEGIEEGKAFQATAVFDRQRYILSITSGGNTENDKTLVFYPDYKGWSIWSFGASCWWQFATTSKTLPALYFGHVSNGRTYEFGRGLNDDGAAISWQWQSKYFDFGATEITKFYEWLDFVFLNYSATVTLEMVFDGEIETLTIGLGSSETEGIGTEVIGTEIVGGYDEDESSSQTYQSYIKRRRLLYGKQSQNLRVAFSGNGLNDDFALLEMAGRLKAAPETLYPSDQLIQ